MTDSMDHEKWAAAIAEILEPFVSIECAKSRWLLPDGSGNGDFDEDISMLFDSFRFEAFPNETKLAFKEEEIDRIVELAILMDRALSRLSDDPYDMAFLNSKEWTCIFLAAQKVSGIIRNRI